MKKDDKYPDQIFVRGHLTDFEKLLLAQTEIANLKSKFREDHKKINIENGILKSEVDELTHKNELLKKEMKQLLGERKTLNKNEIEMELRKEKRYKDLDKKLDSSARELARVRNSNQDLFSILAKYRNKFGEI